MVVWGEPGFEFVYTFNKGGRLELGIGFAREVELRCHLHNSGNQPFSSAGPICPIVCHHFPLSNILLSVLLLFSSLEFIYAPIVLAPPSPITHHYHHQPSNTYGCSYNWSQSAHSAFGQSGCVHTVVLHLSNVLSGCVCMALKNLFCWTNMITCILKVQLVCVYKCTDWVVSKTMTSKKKNYLKMNSQTKSNKEHKITNKPLKIMRK